MNGSDELIGILLLDGDDPRIPGQVAHPASFPFPVVYEVLEGCDAEKILYDRDEGLSNLVLGRARKLSDQGVGAISSNCGFLGHFQQIVASEVNVPVLLSSLLQVPIIKQSLGPKQEILIVTADSTAINDHLLSAVGISDSRSLILEGLQDDKNFREAFITHQGELSPPSLEREIIKRVKQIVNTKNNVGAILMECSVLPPYSKVVREAVDLPVYDFMTLIRYAHDAIVLKEYEKDTNIKANMKSQGRQGGG